MRRAVLLAGLIACATPQATTASRYGTWLSSVKEAFGRSWKPMVAQAVARNDPTGCIWSATDRRTVVQYTVAADGAIESVRLVSSCGVAYLDHVAIESIASVGRVTPPPPQLVNLEIGFALTLEATPGGCEPRKPDNKPGPYVPNTPRGPPQRR